MAPERHELYTTPIQNLFTDLKGKSLTEQLFSTEPTPIKIYEQQDTLELIINSMTFKKDMIRYDKHFDTTSSRGKILYSDFFLRSINGCFQIDKSIVDKMTKELKKIVMDPVVKDIRGMYLRGLNLDVITEVSNHLIFENPDISFRYQIYCYLLTNKDKSKETSELIITDLQDRFHESDLFHKAQIADILINCGYQEEGNVMMNMVRRLEEEKARLEEDRTQLENRILPKLPSNVVYHDTQNVHNTHINNSVKSVANKLVRNYPAVDSVSVITKKMLELYPEHESAFLEVFDRIQIDIVNFDGVRLDDVLKSLWRFINGHEYKSDLLVRLRDEMLDMRLYCSTGYLARIINVMAGFDSELVINVSDDARYKAILFYYISERIRSHDEALEWLTDDPIKLHSFITEILKDKLLLMKEDGDVPREDLVVDIINQYTGFS
jgi:hypothetical protein